MTFPILLALFSLTCAYAYVLEHRTWLLVDWVWMETIVGCSMCLAAVAVAAWFDPALLPGLIAACWAFVIGGLPIVGWSIWRMVSMRDAAIERDEQRKRDGKATGVALPGREGKN